VPKPPSDDPYQPSGEPATLDKQMIVAGVSGVRGAVTACGSETSAKGIVKLTVRVNGDGSVSSVNVTQSPDEALGSCAANAMKKARFARTQNGGTFAFPFSFR
jgi:TonB family protein